MAEPNINPLVDRKKLIGGIEETNAGTFGTITVPLAGTNVLNIKTEVGNFFEESNERTPNGNYEGTLPAVVGKQTGKVSFDVEVSPGDKTLPLLTGCGWKLDTGIYVPTSSVAARKCWSFKVWESGKVKRFAGTAGSTAKLVIKTGARLMASFVFEGVWNGEIAEAMPADPTWGSPYVAMGATYTIGGVSQPHTAQIGVDLGITAQARESLTAAKGVHHFMLGKRRPKITVDPESRLVADNDLYGLLLAGATTAWSYALVSGASTLTIAAPAAQRVEAKGGNRGDYATDSVTMECRADAGDDELTFEEVTTP